MKSVDIRETFLKYFENYHHQRVKSSSLIPAADPTLLFTNAGMVQFKDCFLGLTDPGYRRATTCQKCVRAGGKHNDLENVGFTPRHHTFFEMLGNFSFGDYFKKEAIAFAWELLTRYYHIPKEKLRITVFEKDDEALDLWHSQGIPKDWIYRLGAKDNFWAMGETGPCGPCTEIHFDWGEKYGCKKPSCNPGCECGTRFLEIWNLVFMQFNRDASGTLAPLPEPSVDTGAGLERMASVLQGVYSNYETDLFMPIIQALCERTGKTYKAGEQDDVSMRVVADHLRAGVFLIADGVTPSNEGRGYVLRRILRRAIRHGKKLGRDRPFLFELSQSVIQSLGPIYPELPHNQKIIEVLLHEEEERFHETLHRGIGLLEETLKKLARGKQKVLPGDIAFKLYDTYGFPLDLIQVICGENDITVDENKFQELMEKQKSQSVWSGGKSVAQMETLTKALETKKWTTQFVGYETLKASSKALNLFSEEGKEVAVLAGGQKGFAIFETTPYYAESGGQLGDKGIVSGHGLKAQVQDTFKIAKTNIHRISIEEGKIETGYSYDLQVDSRARELTAINHTATHLLHAALRKVLGVRVKQAGSLVEPERLRFDYTFPRALTEAEIQQIETLINETIVQNAEVDVSEMGFDEALKSGALAFFDEKYGDKVRVIRVGDPKEPFSMELCGGTHLHLTSEIGFFKILSETSIASGVRRIEAITSAKALEFLSSQNNLLKQIEEKVGARGGAAIQKIEQVLQQNKQLQRENEQLKLRVAQSGFKEGMKKEDLKAAYSEINDLHIVREEIPSANPKILRALVDQVRDRQKEKTIVFLASRENDKVSMCVGLTKDLAQRLDASKLIQPLAKAVGGTGGGRADFAQAGGTKPEGLKKAFEIAESWIDKVL